MELVLWRMRRRLSEAAALWVSKAFYRLLTAMEHLNRRASLHGDRAFFSPEQFPWTKQVAAFTGDIQAELDALLTDVDSLPNFQDISPDQVVLTRDGRWKTFFFRLYGEELNRNCERCPRTAEALRLIPGMTTAMFSILAPGKTIPPHRGPYNGVLRYHLGLRVPASDERCAIRVNGDVRHWAEGDALVFDDSYPHDVWNRTAHWRIVLFVDFLRPLPPWAALLNRAMMALIARTSFIRVAVRNHTQWETSFYP